MEMDDAAIAPGGAPVEMDDAAMTASGEPVDLLKKRGRAVSSVWAWLMTEHDAHMAKVCRV
jgi:hypothetical protein